MSIGFVFLVLYLFAFFAQRYASAVYATPWICVYPSAGLSQAGIPSDRMKECSLISPMHALSAYPTLR